MAAPVGSVVTYATSSLSFPNPERGFYRFGADGDDESHPFSEQTLVGYRTNDHITLVQCVFYLHSTNAPIASSQLAFLKKQAATVRKAGLKMILRFAYSKLDPVDDAQDAGARNDASLDWVLAHLDQLKPILNANRDVIAVVQSGFVGAYGEGWATDHYGNKGVVTAANWADRKAIVDKLLAVLPKTRMVQLRTPLMKTTMYGATPASQADASNSTQLGRLGHHNDCFLASSTDSGTYHNAATEYPYLAADTRFVAMGGETCRANPPRSQCPTATSEMAMFHWSYLNRTFKPEVISSWSNGGCLTTIEQRLGYRLVLVSSIFPATAVRGSRIAFELTVRNDGWAAPFNPRPVRLVLRDAADGQLHVLNVPSARPRLWHAGTTTTVDQRNLLIPTTIPAGTYELLLSLPDPLGSLAARPEYAIRLANNNTWEATTGLNRLLRTLTVQ